MFRITEDPSSGSLVQCLAKNYKNDSIVFVDMDKVGVMAACSDPVVQFLLYEGTPSYTANYTHTHTHTHNGSEYIAITPTLNISTDTIESFL